MYIIYHCIKSCICGYQHCFVNSATKLATCIRKTEVLPIKPTN